MCEKVSYPSRTEILNLHLLNILVNWEDLMSWQTVMYRSSCFSQDYPKANRLTHYLTCYI